jgi:hypothetical protein
MPLIAKLLDLFRTQEQGRKNALVQGGPAAQWAEFLSEGKWVYFGAASNPRGVDLAQYLYESETLYIQYKNGAVYSYKNVTYREALDFAQAGSKGEWVWSNLRIRGSKYGHRKPYQLEALGD